jgi:hypothetical protein
MSRFEFSSVLVSIVLAIGVAEVLRTWGQMIRQRRRARPYWVHVGWMALMLLLSIQFWWSLWDLQAWPEWGFFEYVLFLLPFLTLVVLTFLLCPDLQTDVESGMEAYFFENAPWVFSLGAVFIVELMVTNPVLGVERWTGPENGIRLLGLAAIIPLAVVRRRWLHSGALLLCGGLVVAFVSLS